MEEELIFDEWFETEFSADGLDEYLKKLFEELEVREVSNANNFYQYE